MHDQQNRLQAVLDFLRRLDLAKISFRLESIREETIMVRVAVPGERWEFKFFANGDREVERFITSNESVVGGERSQQLLIELFDRFSD